MWKLGIERTFQRDYARHKHDRADVPKLVEEALAELAETGTVSGGYQPHPLANPELNYLGHMEFHLDEDLDLLVIYLPHATQPSIRLVRMGPHNELFHGPVR